MAIYLAIERPTAWYMLRLAQTAYRRAHAKRRGQGYSPPPGQYHGEDHRMGHAYHAIIKLEEALNLEHDPYYGLPVGWKMSVEQENDSR